MIDSEKVVLVKAMTDETDDTIISAFLSLAGDAVAHYVDPYGIRNREEVLDAYGGVQVKAAAYYLNKRGGEGETAHSENGISRSYEAADLPPSILREIVPYCGVIS